MTDTVCHRLSSSLLIRPFNLGIFSSLHSLTRGHLISTKSQQVNGLNLSIQYITFNDGNIKPGLGPLGPNDSCGVHGVLDAVFKKKQRSNNLLPAVVRSRRHDGVNALSSNVSLCIELDVTGHRKLVHG